MPHRCIEEIPATATHSTGTMTASPAKSETPDACRSVGLRTRPTGAPGVGSNPLGTSTTLLTCGSTHAVPQQSAKSPEIFSLSVLMKFPSDELCHLLRRGLTGRRLRPPGRTRRHELAVVDVDGDTTARTYGFVRWTVNGTAGVLRSIPP